MQDSSLRHTLQFGVGLHHAGLSSKDRSLVERLYVDGKIQVLVATSTLAWGVNTPAHLVIVKGTEYFDAASRRYVDYPITDVLQMMGRAGRPQYDKQGVAVIMVHDPKKSFYKKFLYEPFPVESSLHLQLEDHLNAEIATGTIESKQECIDYLTWTFFLRRLMQNPSYYGLEATDSDSVSLFLCSLIDKSLEKLQDCGCIEIDDETGAVEALHLGRIASFYYLSHKTMKIFSTTLHRGMGQCDIIRALCNAAEYEELPVRHNEDNLNAEMLPLLRFPPPTHLVDKPSCKAEILIQAHLGRTSLPVSDYVTDTRSVLDNSMRILQALIDIASERSWWKTSYSAMKTIQSILQGRWEDDNTLMQLPHISSNKAALNIEKKMRVKGLKDLVEKYNRDRGQCIRVLEREFGTQRSKDIARALAHMPDITVQSKFCDEKKTYIDVNIIRNGHVGSRHGAPRAFTPCFPKVKEESWWCAVVNGEDIISLKRLSFGGKTNFKVYLDDSAELMRLLSDGKLPEIYMICDSYLGLDLLIEPKRA